ncbi:MAG TPA: cbb3-type cytochrome c oxidase subunit I [Chloroflexota bacterium]|nr:cbb3-type cytochrome c oxidase subunit I [Chloroflexota bacterium]
MFTREEQLSGAYLGVAIGALAIGMLLGLLQALEHAGIDLYPLLKPLIYSYYQGLTLHGVLNVLIWTTFFICGFLLFVTVRALRQPLASMPLGAATFWLMVIGLGLTLWSMLSNDATVLFTFYPPMRAHPAFYLGLTLIVVGTWLVTANLVLTYRAWRRAHPTARTPLAAFGALITFVMWTIASLGIAAEMLFLNIPWSLGVLPDTNALLARTLFWFTGHPIVYFWLLPTYVSWYTMVPRQAGGKLFSDPMARVAFVLFLVLSTPVGIHHQFTDPGISPNWKLVHAFITFALFFPSLLTFFNVVASLEHAGRARGGRGWLGWIGHLPWQDPALVAQLLAMVLFAFGGIGGLVNASLEVNLAVHNTTWVVGHFHLTVGAAVTLTFMGISYWLVPLLAGRRLWSPRLALAQAWLWFGGMALFAHVLHRLGLLDMPRRTAIGAAPYVLPEWQPFLPWIGVGGAVLFLSGVLYLLNLLLTVSVAPRERPGEVPFAEAVTGPEHAPAILDRWRPWLAFAAVLILIAYGPTLAHLLAATPFNVPARRVW